MCSGKFQLSNYANANYLKILNRLGSCQDYFMSWHNDIYHGSPTTRRYALMKVYDAALNIIVLHDEVEVGHCGYIEPYTIEMIELDARGDSN